MDVLAARIEDWNRATLESVEIAAERALVRASSRRGEQRDLPIVLDKLVLVERGHGVRCLCRARILVVAHKDCNRLMVTTDERFCQQRRLWCARTGIAG